MRRPLASRVQSTASPLSPPNDLLSRAQPISVQGDLTPSTLQAELRAARVAPEAVIAISRCGVMRSARPHMDASSVDASATPVICVVHRRGLLLVDEQRRRPGQAAPEAPPTVVAFDDCSSFADGDVTHEFGGGAFTIDLVSVDGARVTTISWSWRERWFTNRRAARDAMHAERDRILDAIDTAVAVGRANPPD